MERIDRGAGMAANPLGARQVSRHMAHPWFVHTPPGACAGGACWAEPGRWFRLGYLFKRLERFDGSIPSFRAAARTPPSLRTASASSSRRRVA